jgi:hypothetical protein
LSQKYQGKSASENEEELSFYCKEAISQEEYDVARAEYAMKAQTS